MVAFNLEEGLSAQKMAADPRVSCWVTASAGTGKTKILTDRLINLLLLGFSPDKILCLTFTKAAACEMTNRLNDRLARFVAMDQAMLMEQLVLLGHSPTEALCKKARELFGVVLDQPIHIETIHSFSQNLLSRFSFETGLFSGVEVIEDAKAYELLKKAQFKVFCNEKYNPLFQYWSEQMGYDYFNKLFNEWFAQRLSLMRMLNRCEDYPQKIKEILNISQEPENQNISFEPLNQMREVGKILLEKGSAKFQKIGEQIISYFDNPQEEFFENYQSCFLTQAGDPVKSFANKEILKDNPWIQELFEQECMRVIAYKEQKNHTIMYKNTISFVQITQEILKVYHDLKKGIGKLDYNDLLLESINLLDNPELGPWILSKMDGGIEHILMDEAQDTSPEQWLLVEKLTGEFFRPDRSYRTFFAVGDPKQSIYQFQGSNPKDFFFYKDYFKKQALGIGQAFLDIQLSVSFRSTPNVLGVVDHFCNHSIYRSGLCKNEREIIVHHPFRQNHTGQCAMVYYENEEEKKEQTSWPLPVPSQTNQYPSVVQAITNFILDILIKAPILPSTQKPLTSNDILILVRKRSSWVFTLIESLQTASLPIAPCDRLSFKHLLIQDLVAFGNFLLMPEDDYSLACLLKSPFFSVSEERLFHLCQNKNKSGISLWRALQLDDSFESIEVYLKEVLKQVDFATVYELYHYILKETGGHQLLINHFGHLANDLISEFLRTILQLESQTLLTLQHFVTFMEEHSQMIKRANDEAQGIRLMTVHGSKGLQAPVVILADAALDPLGDSDSILWGYDHQNNPDFVLLRPNQSQETSFTKKLKEKHKDILLQENRRLLYVALTRAQDHLYVMHNPSEADALSWGNCVHSFIDKTHECSHSVPTSFHQQITSEIQEKPTWLSAPTFDLKGEEVQKHARATNKVIYNEESVQKGQEIHKLFDVLAHTPLFLREIIAKKKSRGIALEDLEKVLQVFEKKELEVFYNAESQSEVTFQSLMNGTLMHGQIDRLAFCGNEVWVLDFKTGQKRCYKEQMDFYKQGISQLYPGHSCRAFIWWVDHNELEEQLI